MRLFRQPSCTLCGDPFQAPFSYPQLLLLLIYLSQSHLSPVRTIDITFAKLITIENA